MLAGIRRSHYHVVNVMDSKDKSMYRIWNMSGTDVKKYRPSLVMF